VVLNWLRCCWTLRYVVGYVVVGSPFTLWFTWVYFVPEFTPHNVGLFDSGGYVG